MGYHSHFATEQGMGVNHQPNVKKGVSSFDTSLVHFHCWTDTYHHTLERQTEEGFLDLYFVVQLR